MADRSDTTSPPLTRKESNSRPSKSKSPPTDRKANDLNDPRRDRRSASSRTSLHGSESAPLAESRSTRTPEEEQERSRRRREEREGSRVKKERTDSPEPSKPKIESPASARRIGSNIDRRTRSGEPTSFPSGPSTSSSGSSISERIERHRPREESRTRLGESPVPALRMQQVDALLIDDARPKKAPSTLPAALDPGSVITVASGAGTEVRSASGKLKQIALLTVSQMEPLRPHRSSTNGRVQRPGGSLRESGDLVSGDTTTLPLPVTDTPVTGNPSPPLSSSQEGFKLAERQNTQPILTPVSPPLPKSPRSPLYTPRSAPPDRDKSPTPRRPSLKSEQSIAKFNERQSRLSQLTSTVPPLIRCLFDGLRKRSVPFSDFQALPQNLDKYRGLLQDLYTEKDMSVEESATLAGMLLTFLADLPEPILASSLYSELIKISEIDDLPYRWKCVYVILQRLPSFCALFLTDLMKYLLKIGKGQFANFAAILMPLMTNTASDAGSSVQKDFHAVFCMFEEWESIVRTGLLMGTFQLEDSLLTLRSAWSLDELVDLAFNEFLPDTLLLSTLLCTVRYYADPTEMLKKIINIYRLRSAAGKGVATPWRKRLCDRIIDGLRLWLTRFVPEQTELWAHVLKQFMSSLDGVDTSAMLKLLGAEEGVNALRAKMGKSSSTGSSPFPGVKLKVNHDQISLKDTSEKELAAQLTLIDLDILKLIRRDEFLEKSIADPVRSPNFTNMVNRFNSIGLWLASEVVKRPTPQERADWLAKWIKLAKKLIRLNNFHTCYAIYCALHSASLQRLKLSWEKVPKKYTSTLKDLSVLFDQRQNYSAYRAALAAARPPVVPYMIIFSKYLVAIEETSPTWEERADGGKSINWAKMRYLYKVIDQVQSHQAANYAATSDIKVNSSLRAYLQSPPHYEEEEVFHHSVIVEPKKGLNVLD